MTLSSRAEQAKPEAEWAEWTTGETVIYCHKCNGPALGVSRLYLALCHAAYWLVIKMPLWNWLWKPSLALMPYAGQIAFACSCPEHHKQVRARRGR